MKIKFFILFLCLFCASIASADSWLLYAAVDSDTFGTSSIYMMKIDSLGNVRMNPVKLFDQSSCRSCVGAMTDGDPGKINLILVSATGSEYSLIRRAIVDKATLQVSGAKSLGIYQSNVSWPVSIQTTQHASRRFMVTEVNDDRARAFGLNSNGFWDGRKWRANPAVSKGVILQVGVSPDGGMSWAMNASMGTNTKMYLQPLRSDGLPMGSPSVGGSAEFPLGGDITNLLPGNVRYFAYHDMDTRTLHVNVVNGLTGKKLVSRDFGDSNTQFVQSVALDPQGRFLVYSEVGNCGHHELRYQALDGSGKQSGASKVLVSCDPDVESVLPDLYED